MATIINNPPPERDHDLIVERDSSSSAGLLTGILVVVLVLVLIAFVGLPYIRSTSTYSTPGAPSTGGPVDSTSPSDYNYNTTNVASSTNYYNMSPATTSPY